MSIRIRGNLVVPSVNRRRLLQAAVGAGLGTVIAGCAEKTSRAVSTTVIPAKSLKAMSLAGTGWNFHQKGESAHLPAIVPGSTYTDLLRNGKIPNPFYRENNGVGAKGGSVTWTSNWSEYIREVEPQPIQWVAEKNWVYERTFHVPEELLSRQHIYLQCDGLDTLATLWINDQKLGHADNMFRQWSFNIKPHLRRGINTLRVEFDTLGPTVEKLSARYKAQHGITLPDPRSWIRKAPYMWGWDWCRPLLTQGIWRDIRIEAFDAKISHVGVHQHHQSDGSVRLSIDTAVMHAPAYARVSVSVSLGGKTVAVGHGPINHGQSQIELTIAQPELWWPNGMGPHPLYVVSVELSQANIILHSHCCRIGLREIEVLPPHDGVAMHVKVNGVPVFVKGADWVPADNLPTRVTPEILRYYMKTAVDCNFNFIRLWGGGYYEQDELFDLCDELGLMLQFEFKFANDIYPVHDAQWMANLRNEISEQVLRCRNHPAIVIWSGNNEIQQFQGYYHMFRDVIGGIVHRLVPGAFYEVGSGATGSGDIHTWQVWHNNAPFEQWRTVEGFVTEFGMQSFPAPQTVDTYTTAADRDSIHSPVMRFHECDGSNHGIGIIMHYTNMYFGKAPQDFDSTLLLTQIDQAYGIRYGVEHWRRDMPRSMASTIWQFNDCWPGPTWSMIDYDRRWKAVLYQSRHFFAPIIVSGIPDAKTGVAGLHVTSDHQHDYSGELEWMVTDLQGNALVVGQKDIHIPAHTSGLAHHLDLADLIKSHGENNLLIWANVMIDGRTVAENTLYFPRPLELKLPKPNIAYTITGSGCNYHLKLTADRPALWCFARLKAERAVFSDNFFHLPPGREKNIYITLEDPLPHAELVQRLSIGSVYDLAPDMRQGT